MNIPIDLVVRLRNKEERCLDYASICEEAATEIERLRDVLGDYDPEAKKRRTDDMGNWPNDWSCP